MGLIQPPPYKVRKKDGSFVTVTPPPREYNTKPSMIGMGSGSNHKHFDLVLLESKMTKLSSTNKY